MNEFWFVENFGHAGKHLWRIYADCGFNSVFFYGKLDEQNSEAFIKALVRL